MLRKTLGTMALAATLPFAACDDGTGFDDPASLSLLLTDAPGDFQTAVVQVERIELAGGDGEEDGPVIVRDVPFETDLLTLANDVAEIVEDYPVPAGTYSQLRFIIPAACISVEGETEGETLVYASADFESVDYPECDTPDGSLQLPSFDQTGIKVNFPDGALTLEGERVILLDFDVSESFGQQAGGSGMWVMTPVINATDVSLSGSLTVALDAAAEVDFAAVNGSLDDFRLRLAQEAEPVAFSDPDDDGIWEATFLFLLPGEYDLTLELEDGVEYDFVADPTSPQALSVGDAEDVETGFTVTSVAPATPSGG